MKINIVVFYVELRGVKNYLLSFWIIEGILAAAEWPQAPVLERGQVELFTVHVYSFKFLKIKL